MATAWLEWNGILYWARYERLPFEPRSALLCLVEGIWQHQPHLAHFILRSRVFVDYEPTALCRGTVVVCAKRLSQVAVVPEEVKQRMASSENAVFVGRLPGKETSQQLRALLDDDAPDHRPPYQRDRSIEAWLLSAEGRLLGCEVNSSGRNRTMHAEMNLLHAWWRRERKPLPSRARILTTLEPCPMCAGAIWECLEQRESFSVQYLQPDPGTAVRRSVLRGTRILERCKNIEQEADVQVTESIGL